MTNRLFMLGDEPPKLDTLRRMSMENARFDTPVLIGTTFVIGNLMGFVGDTQFKTVAVSYKTHVNYRHRLLWLTDRKDLYEPPLFMLRGHAVYPGDLLDIKSWDHWETCKASSIGYNSRGSRSVLHVEPADESHAMYHLHDPECIRLHAKEPTSVRKKRSDESRLLAMLAVCSMLDPGLLDILEQSLDNTEEDSDKKG